jgi:branched-subunit amino acid ABC-type transport system permease component
VRHLVLGVVVAARSNGARVGADQPEDISPMSETVPFILAGIASGAIYSLAGVGLVLTFKTSGILNFAHGALASVGALGFYALTVVTGVPPVVGTLVVLIGASALIGLLAEPFAARLASKPLALKVAGTVGVLLAVQGTAGVLLDGNTDYFPSLLPAQGIALGGLTIGVDQLIGVAISLSCAVGLSVFFKVARTGRAMRAVVDNPDLMGLSGIDPRRIRRIAWIIGAFLVTLSGLLLAPHLAVNGNGLTMLVVQAFGAAAIGSFRHVWRTWFGGLIVGIVSSLATAWFGSVPTLQGLPAAVPFLVLFVVLTVSRRTTGWAIVPRVQAHPRAPLRHQILPALTAFGFFAIVPFFAGPYLGGWTISLAYVVLFLSMGLLLRHSGQVSLGHVSFAAIGAVSFSQFTVELGLPWLVGLLLAGLVVVPIGAVLAVPAIRASGLYLAIATFGFGLVMQNLFYSQDYMFGTNSSGRPMPQPDILVGTDGQAVAYYYVLLVIVVAVAVGVVAIVRTRLGRLLTALSDAPVALASVGTSVNSVKILVFCLSAFMAGLGGALYGVAFGAVTAQSFDPIISLSLVTLIVITVGGAP